MIKNLLFFFTLIITGKLIDYNLIQSIPEPIYREFFIVYCITTFLYYILRWFLNKFVKSFRNIQPEHKKMYVCKNFIKSFFLAGLCTQLHKYIGIFNGPVDMIFTKRCALYYIMNDVIGLLVVKKLPKTTIIHHITTSLCGLAIIMKQSDTMDILTLIVLYAIFSSMAFCVNFYLGLRIYSNNVQIKRYLSNFSFWIYLLSCLVNWFLQLKLFYQIYPTFEYFYILFYLGFLYSVGKDDIILMKWLYDDHNNFKKIALNK